MEINKMNLAYESGSDALTKLLMLREGGGFISKSPAGIMILSSGEPYYFAEVTCKDGSHYVIEAMGREAFELCEASSRVKA
jgi:hypothetical protein